MTDIVRDNDGNEYKAGEFIEIPTGEKDSGGNPITEEVMFLRIHDVPICEKHKFDNNHECTVCPYMFVGFQANKHIQTSGGIYMRLPGNKLGKRIA